MTIANNPYSRKSLISNTFSFLTGKLLSAILNFIILLLLVRILSIKDYGIYITFIALLELVSALSSFGLPWVTAKYIPDYRVNATSQDLMKLATGLVFSQSFVLLVLVFGLYLQQDFYLQWVNLHQYKALFTIFLFAVLFEGVARYFRDHLMSALMLQKASRLSLVARHVVYLIGFFFLNKSSDSLLFDIVKIEVLASLISLTIAIFSTWLNLHKLKDKDFSSTWNKVNYREMFKVAVPTYISYMFSLIYSPSLLLNISMKMLGAEATALFGFIKNLHDQVYRYLPASLLFNLIRPKLVASYVQSQDVHMLSNNANFAGKLSLFVLATILTISVNYGSDWVNLISGAKFHDSGLALFGILLGLVPLSQRQLLESLLVILGHAKVSMFAALSGLITLPVLFVLLSLGWGVWSLIAVVILGHFTFNFIVTLFLAKTHGYSPDLSGSAKLLFITLATSIVAYFLPINVSQSIYFLLLATVIVTVLFLFIAWLVKPFSSRERNLINEVLKRKLFVW